MFSGPSRRTPLGAARPAGKALAAVGLSSPTWGAGLRRGGCARAPAPSQSLARHPAEAWALLAAVGFPAQCLVPVSPRRPGPFVARVRAGSAPALQRRLCLLRGHRSDLLPSSTQELERRNCAGEGRLAKACPCATEVANGGSPARPADGGGGFHRPRGSSLARNPCPVAALLLGQDFEILFRLLSEFT